MEELLKFVEPLDEAKEENKPLRGGPADQFETGQAWLHLKARLQTAMVVCSCQDATCQPVSCSGKYFTFAFNIIPRSYYIVYINVPIDLIWL